MQLVVTNSMRTCFEDCKFGFFCEYIRRLTPKREPAYFMWGRLVHGCEAAVEGGGDVEDGIAIERKATEERTTNLKELETFEEMSSYVGDVIDAHMLRWHEDDKRYEQLSDVGLVEGRFEMPLPSGFLFKGKIDKHVVDRQTGNILVWERKTASQVDEDYWDSKYLDSQPKGYCLASQRAIGLDVRRVMYDLYIKPQIRHKKWQTREMYLKELGNKYLLERNRFFERRTITFTQEEIDAYYWDIDQVTQEMMWHMTEGIWPKHHAGNRIGGCLYKPLCLRGDAALSLYYTRDKNYLNPELV